MLNCGNADVFEWLSGSWMLPDGSKVWEFGTMDGWWYWRRMISLFRVAVAMNGVRVRYVASGCY